MTGGKNCALQVPSVAPFKALGNFPKALYGTTGGTTCLTPDDFTHQMETPFRA